MKRTMFGIGFLFLLLVLFPSVSAAQNSNPCVIGTMWWFPDPLPFGWFFAGPGEGPFSAWIETFTTGCLPTPEVSCAAQAPVVCGNKPVFFGNGNTLIDDVDLSLPGLGGGLSLRRSWNSVWPATEAASSVGVFGPNWRSTYEERVFVNTDNQVEYNRGDGSYWGFQYEPLLSEFIATSPKNGSVLQSTYVNQTIAFKDGEQRYFSPSTGLLTKIIDRNHNTTQLTYDSSNRLTTVTSPGGQHLYFNYGTGSLNYLVTSVTTDVGITLSYMYDTDGRLVQVTKPDQTTVSYTYNLQSQITAVTDSNGKILEAHTYDSTGQGLTASQANGVNAISVTYP